MSDATTHEPCFEELEQRLLAIGGDRVVDPGRESDLAGLVAEGEEISGEISFVSGIPSECHQNSARLWEQGSGQIATGYALSSDGLWRQHTWVLGRSGQIVETTTRRTRYFGIILGEDIAEIFAARNR